MTENIFEVSNFFGYRRGVSNPPKPTALRRLDGGTERNNLVSHRPQPRATVEGIGDPHPNPWFNREERECYDKLVAAAPPGLLTSADQMVIETFCIMWARMRACDNAMVLEGYLVPTKGGGVKRSPYALIRSDAAREVDRAAKKLGLSPLARMRILGKLGDRLSDLEDSLIEEAWR